MHHAVEEEGLLQALVPSAVGRKHVVVLPEIYLLREHRAAISGFIVDAVAFDEDGVREHVHIVLELEESLLGIVGAVRTLDYLPVLVLHGRPAREECEGVLGIVVQEVGAEGVVVLVLQLHQCSARLDEVFVDDVVHLVGGEDGALLHHPHVAPGIDNPGIHVPEGRVADEVGVVVEEGGVDGLAEIHPALLYEFKGFGLDEAHQTVLPLSLVLGGQAGAQKECDGKDCYFLTFAFHPSREKSQSPNMGSITM